MAEGYRIAEGFVEVQVVPSREKLRAAAQEAATEFEAASTGRYSTAGEHAGREFATGARTAVGRDLETAIGASADKTGTDFVMHVERTLRGAGTKMEKAGEDIASHVETGLRSTASRGIGDIFKDAAKTAKQAFSDAGSDISNLWGQVGDGVSKVTSQFSSGLTSWPVVLAGVAGGLEVIPPVLYAIAGGLASIPALAVGAGMALATLELGTQGIGAAIGEVFNPRGGGGGGAANRVDQLASAERNLASAQRSEREAQQALTDARVQAAFHLQDLNLQMERQQENERGAALAIMEAQQALMQAQATGDPLQVMRAQLALQEAVTGLKEQKQQTVELSYTKQQADAKGVEGSDQVVAALDRVQNATNAVADAQASLRQASVSAAAGVVSAYSKLSPEAKKFVDEIRRLKPEFVGLQQYVQDRMFAGLDRKLGVWATVWIPDLRKNLGMLAGDANTFAKRLGDDLSKPQVVSAVDRISGVFDRLFQKFTGQTLDKLVTGVSALVDKASPFVESLAGSALDKLGGWADDLSKAAKDGSLTSFFKEASKDIRDIWNIGSDVADIIGKILDAAFGETTSQHNGENGLDRLKSTLDDFDAWAGSDRGQKTIKSVADAFMAIVDAIGWVVVNVGKLVAALEDGYEKNRRWVRGIRDDFGDLKDTVVGGMRSFVGSVVGAFSQFLTAADHAFSWIPGLGGKLDGAKRDMDIFVGNFNRDVDNMRSRKDFTVFINAVASAANVAVQAAMGHRWGGVHWADQGLLSLGNRSAGIYSGGPLLGFAEPDTGGEIFIPKHGEPSRNKALTAVAAQWSGMDVVPARSPIAAGMGMTGTATAPRAPQTLQVHVGGEHLVDVVLAVIDDHVEVVSAAAVKGDRKRRFTNSARP